jgi:hypothetical protein
MFQTRSPDSHRASRTSSIARDKTLWGAGTRMHLCRAFSPTDAHEEGSKEKKIRPGGDEASNQDRRVGKGSDPREQPLAPHAGLGCSSNSTRQKKRPQKASPGASFIEHQLKVIWDMTEPKSKP